MSKQFVNVETMVSRTYREWQKEIAPVALRAALARGQIVEDRSDVLGPARAKWDAEHPIVITERVALDNLLAIAEAEGEAFDESEAVALEVTPLQFEMLKRIALSEYTAVNGSEPESVEDVGEVWADDVITTAADKGVFTSLLNAGLVTHLFAETQRFEVRNDNTVSLTQAGFLAYKAASVKAPVATGATEITGGIAKVRKARAAKIKGALTVLQVSALEALQSYGHGGANAAQVASDMGFSGEAIRISGVLSSLKERGKLETHKVKGGGVVYMVKI